MAVIFWYIVKSDLSSVRYCTRIHSTRHFLQGTRKTRPYLTGHPVLIYFNILIERSGYPKRKILSTCFTIGKQYR